MNIIEQDTLMEVDIKICKDQITLIDFCDESVTLDKSGAKQLIEILKEFVNED